MPILNSAVSLIDFDHTVQAPLHGFAGVDGYYRAMSPASDDRLRDLKVPTLALNALDDPIVHPDTMGKAAKLATTTNDHLFVLLTEQGGHCGWPVGLIPSRHGWRFMSSSVIEFVEAVLHLWVAE